MNTNSFRRISEPGNISDTSDNATDGAQMNDDKMSGAKINRIKWPGSLGLLILLGWAASGCGGPNQVNSADTAPAASVVKVTRRDLADNLEIASEFQPNQEIEVYAKVSGYIQKLSVNWGTHVKQGQLLAELEIPELQQQLQEDEASVHRSESVLESAREDLKQAQSDYNVAHLTYTRLANVQKTQPGLVAQQDIDISQGKDTAANAGAAGAKDALAAAEQGVDVAKSALEKDKAMYAYARITAPFDGVVTELHAYTGALLPAGTSSNIGSSALCRLSQNDMLRLVIPVPERAVPDVHVGQTISVKVSSLDKTFPGKISLFSGQIDSQTRTMHTEVEVPNPNYLLVPGMYASVEIPVHSVGNVLTLPVQAVQTTGDGKGTVMVVNSQNTLESHDVVIGLQTATEVEILSGLQENEMVLFGGQGQYKPGQVVSPKVIEAPSFE
jgi:RND family efflux transporter MFP subunit